MAAPLFSATPDSPIRGGVVVIQEAFGITKHIESICTRLAAEGWLAVAPHLFHRSGDPVMSYDDISAVRPHTDQLTAGGITEDVDDALAFLAGSGVGLERTTIVGFCMGGTVSLAMATIHPLAAAATYYGGGVTTGRFGFPPLVEIAPSLRAPWIGFFGDDDKGIPLEQVELLRAAAEKAPVLTEVVHYPDAGHGFNCDDRDAYAPEAAADAWRRMLAWFAASVPEL
jgi:carboxymethylenebutenolidase